MHSTNRKWKTKVFENWSLTFDYFGYISSLTPWVAFSTNISTDDRRSNDPSVEINCFLTSFSFSPWFLTFFHTDSHAHVICDCGIFFSLAFSCFVRNRPYNFDVTPNDLNQSPWFWEVLQATNEKRRYVAKPKEIWTPESQSFYWVRKQMCLHYPIQDKWDNMKWLAMENRGSSA